MFYTEVKISIKRPAEEIFAFLSDLHNEKQWYPFTMKINGPLGKAKKGSKYTRHASVGTLSETSQIEILSCNPPRTFSYKETGNPGRSTMSYELTDNNDHTTVRLKISIVPRNSMNRYMEQVMFAPFVIQMNEALLNLKNLLDSHS